MTIQAQELEERDLEAKLFKSKLAEAFDGLKKRDSEIEARLTQLETDIGVIATHLGYLRNLSKSQLVHKDSPMTKADSDALIVEVLRLICKPYFDN